MNKFKLSIKKMKNLKFKLAFTEISPKTMLNS